MKPAKPLTSKPLTKKKLDDAIQASFKRHASGVQFNMMDLGKIDRDVRAAYTATPTLEAIDSAMVAAVARYRVDRVPEAPRCGCSVNAPEADPAAFPCPCGDHCTDPACVAARGGS